MWIFCCKCTLQLFSFFLQFWISFILQCVCSHVFCICAYFLVFCNYIMHFLSEYVYIFLYSTTFLFLAVVLNQLLYSARCIFSWILHLWNYFLVLCHYYMRLITCIQNIVYNFLSCHFPPSFCSCISSMNCEFMYLFLYSSIIIMLLL